jgi:maleate isomerase
MSQRNPVKIEPLVPRFSSINTALPRLGVIALATDLTFERDAARLIDWDEARLHVARIPFDNPTTPDNLRAMGPNLETAAALLVPGVELSAIAFACTSASITLSNETVTQAIGLSRPNVPVVTPSSAGLAALKALGAKRIALLTPYLTETTAPVVRYFETNSIAVKRCGCFGLGDDRDMARIDLDALVEAAVSLDDPDVEALFLSCTSLPAVDVIEAIETRIGKPVVSSNQATLWVMRGLAGLPAPARRAGRLFDYPPPDASGAI